MAGCLDRFLTSQGFAMGHVRNDHEVMRSQLAGNGSRNQISWSVRDLAFVEEHLVLETVAFANFDCMMRMLCEAAAA